MAKREQRYEETVKTSVGDVLVAGMLTGSLIAVLMLLCSIAVAAPYVGLNEGLAMCLSFIVAGVGAGILQQAWFNYQLALRLPYSGRLAGFAVTYYVVIAACGVLAQWFPATVPGAWAMFTVIYLAIFAAISLFIGHSLKKRGVAYKEKLDEYREEQGR